MLPITIVVYDIYLTSLVVAAMYSTNDNYYINGVSIKNSIERGNRAQENTRYALYKVKGVSTQMATKCAIHNIFSSLLSQISVADLLSNPTSSS